MKKILTFFALLIFAIPAFAQVYPDFNKRGEAYFKFNISDRSEISKLTRIISIDNVKGNEVYAYASKDEFEKFAAMGYSWTLLPPPGEMTPEKDLRMGMITKSTNSSTIWNFYPPYEQYLDFMSGFASSYPEICKVDTIGLSGQGRLIIAVKISDSVNEDQAEPQVLLTSSIHGDETTGYVLMLHLIDSLLTSYGTSERITSMINNTQIFINPLANPDGTYKGGNGSVFSAWRYNANAVDLNRNFPDPKVGNHPDGKQWQIETKAFMKYDTTHRFVISANFHGGAEVYNYPWDTWAKLHADDSWMQFTGREYVDTVHKYSPSTYMDDLDNGITNGFAWYEVNGGRQDYTTYFHHGREATIELSNTKLLPASQLLNHWKYNKRSFLNYIDEALYGVNGQVTDTVTHEPLHAKVFIQGHDIDSSYVYSDAVHGWYYRLIDQGNWALTFTCPGYYTKTVEVNVASRQTTRNNVALVPLTYGVNEKEHHKVAVYPNPSDGQVSVIMPVDKKADLNIKIYSESGKLAYSSEMKQVQGNPVIRLDLSDLPSGNYLLDMSQDEMKYQSKIILKK